MEHDALMDEAPLPPPPRRNGLGSIQRRRRFVDATDDFWSACSQLALGQMVHPPTFTLLDTMACIAIGDPRMDSGIHPLPSDLVPAADRRDDASSSSADFNPHALLTAQDVAWIMDRLMACEAAFHKSAPLSQTLYTCLYFHDIETLSPRSNPTTYPLESPDSPHPAFSQLVLQAYLIATVKCFGLVWSELVKGNILEGEDAITDLCGLSLFEELTVNQALHHLKAAESWLRRSRADLVASSQSVEVVDTLLARIAIRKDILRLLNLFAEQLAPGSRSQIPQFNTAHSPEEFEELVVHCANGVARQCTGLKNAAASRPVSIKAAPSSAAAAAFDPSYGRRLQNAGGVPPAPIELPPLDEVAALWDRSIRRCRHTASVYRLECQPRTRHSWEAIDALLTTQAALFTEQPSTAFGRSLLHSCLVAPGVELPTPFYGYMQSVTGVEDLDNLRIPFDDPAGRWLNKADSILTSIWLEMIGNRPRAKRSLARCYTQLDTFIAETVQLEEAAAIKQARLSQYLHSGALWLLQSTLTVQIIMAGFDLHLYSPAELGMAYWLVEYFANARRGDYERIGKACVEAGFLLQMPDALSDDWLGSCSAGYKYLAVQAQQSSAGSMTAPWTSDDEHSKAVFQRRFKWLARAHQSREQRLLSSAHTWQRYRNWELGVLADTPSAVATRCATHLQDAARGLAAVLRDTADSASRWSLCREEAYQLHHRFARTLAETLRRLKRIAGPDADIGLPSETDGQDEQELVPHAWFPLLLPHPPQSSSAS